MTAFDDMIDALFADPNMASDAVWTPDGGAPVTVRIMQAAPVDPIGAFDVKAKAAPLQVQIRMSEAPDLAEGDILAITAATAWWPSGQYEIRAPEADRGRLCWTMSLRKVA